MSSYDDLLRDRRRADAIRGGKVEIPKPDLSHLNRLRDFGDLLLKYATEFYELGQTGRADKSSEAAKGLWAIVRGMDRELLETQRERDRFADECALLRDELEKQEREIRTAL